MNPNERIELGRNALHYAFKYNKNLEVAKYLIEE